MEDNTPNYYGIIPANVRYSSDVCSGAKLLYCELTALAKQQGYCWATNAYFAKLYKNSNDTISRWIGELKSAGFVDVEVDNKAGGLRRIWITEQKTLPKKDRTPIGKNAEGVRQKDRTPIGKNAEGVRQKDRTPIGKNAAHNNTVNSTDKNKSEKEKEITRLPSENGYLAEGTWRLKFQTEPDLINKLNAWILEQAKSKIWQAISSFNHSYSQSQLDAYVEKEAAILPINYDKLKVSINGDIINCDTVHHILNTAKAELRNTNTLSIPLPKKDTVKRTLPAEVIFKF